MKSISLFFMFFLIISCGRRHDSDTEFISVSIAPFKYFVEEISGGRFEVNVMVPAGSDPHIYEPSPQQISRLQKSVAYISNGCLGFETTWLDRFYEINRNMKKLCLADNIDLIASDHHNDSELYESADPHYWVSPICAKKISSSVNDFLATIDPANKDLFETNYRKLNEKISSVDSMARELSYIKGNKAFMIYHPTLSYLARDYGLEELAMEHEGKEPTPSGLKSLIDRAKKDKLSVILIQKENDKKNVSAIVDETGAKIMVIDPLSEDWYTSISEIIGILRNSISGENHN
jgi:zinc transport system substrate-binding protein